VKRFISQFIPGRVFSLAFPVMLGMLSQVLLNVVDTAMVGRLSAAALAATALGSTAFLVIALTFESLGTGTQILASRRWGENDPLGSSRVLFNSLILTLPLGLLLSFLGASKILPFMHLLIADPEVLKLATVYTRLRFFSLFFILMVSSLRGYFDGIGKTGIRMQYMILVVGLNVVLNYLLIFGKMGFPRLEVAGAALATTFSVIIGAFYILACALLDKGLRRRPFFRRDNYCISIINKIFYFSLPKGLRMLFGFSAFLIFLKIVGLLGVAELAASNILITILSCTLLMGLGIGIAAATLVSNSLGARKPQAARYYGWASCRMGVAFMGLGGLAFILFPRFIVSVFTPDPTVIELAVVPLAILGAVQVFHAVGIVLTGCLEGAGATHWVLKMEIITHWLILIPLAYFLAVIAQFGIVGAWSAIGFLIVLYSLIMIIKFRGESWLNISA